MKTISVIILSALCFCSCQTNQKTDQTTAHTDTKSTKNNNMDIQAIKKQMLLQVGMDSNGLPREKVHFLEQKDINLSLEIIAQGLLEAGYKKPEKGSFEKKIKEIYNCENSDNKDWKGLDLVPFISPDSWMSDQKFIEYYGNNADLTERNNYHMIAFGNDNFIFDINFLKNLIVIKQDGKYEITLPKYLIARNKYLFNDSKTDLDYLIQHDKDFIISLVSVFGYDQVAELNAVALEEFKTGNNEDKKIGRTIFTDFTKPGKLLIRKGLLKFIKDHTDSKDNKLYMGLENFVFDFGDEKKFTKVAFEDKCKMLAYAGTLGEQLQQKFYAQNPSIWSVHSILTNFKIHYPKFIDEIKKKDYYGDSEIKKAVLNAEDEALQATTHADPQ